MPSVVAWWLKEFQAKWCWTLTCRNNNAGLQHLHVTNCNIQKPVNNNKVYLNCKNKLSANKTGKKLKMHTVVGHAK